MTWSTLRNQVLIVCNAFLSGGCCDVTNISVGAMSTIAALNGAFVKASITFELVAYYVTIANLLQWETKTLSVRNAQQGAMLWHVIQFFCTSVEEGEIAVPGLSFYGRRWCKRRARKLGRSSHEHSEWMVARIEDVDGDKQGSLWFHKQRDFWWGIDWARVAWQTHIRSEPWELLLKGAL